MGLTYTHSAVLSHFSQVWLFATLGTVARQGPLSMAFSRQEYWSGLPCPRGMSKRSPQLRDQTPVSCKSLALQADSLPLSHQRSSDIYTGEGNGNPLQYSCLENPMDGGAWWATVHGVAKSQILLKRLSIHTHGLKQTLECKFLLQLESQ